MIAAFLGNSIFIFSLGVFVSVLFIPRHTIVVGYYGFTLVVRESVPPSVRPSLFRFRMIT